MTKIDDNTLDKIKQSTDIVSLVSSYVKLKKAGRNYIGLCPFHSEKTPSFSVNEEGQFFHCFGCGAGGDAIEFLRKIENLSFMEAVKTLAKNAGIHIENSNENDEIKQKRERLYKINALCARFFYNSLSQSKKAKDYLKKRDITPEMRNSFGLGYAFDDWDSLIEEMKDKASLEELLSLGLIKKSKNGNYYDTFRDRIIFPIIDVKNRVIGFGGRAIEDIKPKYLNSSDSEIFTKGNNLYALNLVKKYSDRKEVFLTEGYMDVISLFKQGIMAVASLGTSLTERQAELISRFSDNVYILYDSDEAGKKASLRALDVFSSQGYFPYVMDLKDAKDPDEYFKNHNKDDFLKLKDNSKTPYLYRMNYLKEKYDISIPEEKIKLIKEFLYMTEGIKNSLDKEVTRQKFAEDLNISYESMKGLKTGYVKTKEETVRLEPINKPEIPDYLEFQLLKLYALRLDDFEKYYNFIKNFEFKNQDFGKISHMIGDFCDENPEIKRFSLYDKLSEKLPENKEILDKLFYVNDDFLCDDIEAIKSELNKVCDKRNLEKLRESLILSLKDMSEDSDKREILEKIAQINEKIKFANRE